MALQKQLIPLGFNGLQTKIDPKNAPLGTFAIIENFVINEFHNLQKRDGFQFIGNHITPGPRITTIGAMYRMNDEIGIITDRALYSYSEARDSLLFKGSCITPIVTADPIIANTFIQTHPDSSVTDNKILGVIWEDSRGGVRCTIQDLVDDTILISDHSLSTTGEKPKAIGSGNYLFFLWIETTNLKIIRYSSVNNTFSTISNVSTNINTQKVFDVIRFFSNILIVFAENVAVPDVIKATYWAVNQNVVGSPGNGLPALTSLGFANSGTNPPTLSLSCFPDLESYFVVTLFNNTDNNIYASPYTATFLPLTGVYAPAGGFVPPQTCNYVATVVDNNNNLYVFYDNFDNTQLAKHSTYRTFIAGINTATPGFVNQLLFWYLQLVSKGFFYGLNAFFILQYSSNLQSTYFLVRDNAILGAKLFATLAGAAPTKNNCLTSITLNPLDPTNSTFITALLKLTKVESINNTFYTTSSVFTENIFFKPFGIDNSGINRNLLVAGGFIKQYDGYEGIYEQGFNLYPEAPTGVVAGAGTGLAPGTYSYIITFEWTDNSGQIVRSGTSVPLTVVVAATSTVTLTIQNLCITARNEIVTPIFEFGRTAPIIAVYRTLANGSTFFRVNQLLSEYVYNNIYNQSTIYVDSKTDAQINSNTVLYTTGGVLDNIGSYACNFLVDAKNRIVFSGTDVDPFRVFFSKEKQEGTSIEFSQELSFSVDYFGGNITALAAMDDKIIIFKKSLIYFVSGQGPDALGNGAFTLPQLVSSDAGCNQPHSIVLMSLGLMFKSAKGIYLLSRQLNVDYIGQGVDAYNNLTITSGLNLADQNRVIFTTLEGRTLVYDTFFSQWFTFTNQIATNSVLGKNAWYFCDQANVYVVNPAQTYDRNGEAIQSKIKTNWINLANIEGYYRVYYIYILGDNQLNDHRLVANLYYDFENYPRETLSIIPNTGLTTYGEATPYGNETPYGGALGGDYQYVIRPKQEKCTSIMIELFDQFPDGNKSKSFRLSEISIVYGLKTGGNKNLSANRRLRA